MYEWGSITKLLTWACAMPLVSVLAVALIYYLELPSLPYNLLAIPSLTVCISAFTALCILITAWSQKEKPKNKLLPILETLCVIVIAAGIVYWKLYQFWGVLMNDK